MECKATLDQDYLYSICNKYQFFTCGTCEQYEKLFAANRAGAPLESLAIIIWTCSDPDIGLAYILDKLL